MKNRIRELRRARGLTLAQLAQRVDTTPQTVSRLETSVMTLSLDWLERLAAALEVRATDLLDEAAPGGILWLGDLGPDDILRAGAPPRDILGLPLGGNPVALRLTAAAAGYAAGDILIANRTAQPDPDEARLNRDHLVGRSGGRVSLARLIRSADEALTLLPLAPGTAPIAAETPIWTAPILYRVTSFRA